MTTIRSKLLEAFRRGLKSDAVPQPPRSEPEVEDQNFGNIPDNNENKDTSNDPEEIFYEQDHKDESKPKEKQSFFKKSKKKDNKKQRKDSASNVNTQATGNVINIVNGKDIHLGDEYTYYIGATNTKKTSNGHCEPEEDIKKDNLITLLMESKIKPDHEYIEYISKNLGKNWHSIFRALGYTKGRIETFELDEARNGVSEARYKLLLDWVRNDDDGTLGHLASVLWAEGERHVVKDLSLIYKKNY